MTWRNPCPSLPSYLAGQALAPVSPMKPGLLREDLQQQGVFHQLLQSDSGLEATEVSAPKTKAFIFPMQLSLLPSRCQACNPRPHCTSLLQPRVPGRLQWGTGGGPRVTMGLQGIDEPLPQRLHISTSYWMKMDMGGCEHEEGRRVIPLPLSASLKQRARGTG